MLFLIGRNQHIKYLVNRNKQRNNMYFTYRMLIQL